MLTYHPFNSHIKKIFLTNFNILMNNETTRGIFPLSPLTSYRWDQNIRDILMHTSMKSQSVSGQHIPLWHPQMPHVQHGRSCVSHHHHRWTTTQYRHKGTFHLQIQQCCLLHLMSSLPGPIHWKIGCMLRERTGEHGQAITRNPPSLPAAKHFNKPRQGLDDMEVHV